MATPASTHPADELLAQFVLGRLPDPDDAAVEWHLADCPDCQARAAAARPSDPLLTIIAAVGTRSGTTLYPGADATPPAVARTWTTEFTAADVLLPEGLARHPRYRIVRPLGRGGMGVVWLAEHTLMGRMVALKVIHPALLDRPGAVERFRREVRAAARLHHPNVVTAHDAEEAGGTHFLVTEYVPGETLLAAVRRGPLPVAEACRAARDAARGLAAAHAAGLVHRDVKPANLIRAADGTVKVLDFGLVGVGAGGGGLTGENVVMGTPDYIAPEQAADPAAADARSDVYALGCTLYHLLAGRVPYPAPTPLGKLDAHRNPATAPDPVPGLPPGLAAVLGRMTATDPAARYPTAAAVAEALAPFCGEPATRPDSAPPRRRPRWRTAVGLLGLAAVLAVAGVVYTIQRENAVVTVETNDPDIEVVLRRNGELVRIVDTKTKKTWELDTTTRRLAVGEETTIDLPGREPLVLRRAGEAVVTIRHEPKPAVNQPASTGGIREVRRFEGVTESVQAVAISPDGKRVAAGGGHLRGPAGFKLGSDFAVRVWDLATGELALTLRGHINMVSAINFSRDGRRIATASADGTVRVWDAENGRPVTVVRHPNPTTGVTFTPDGKRILVTGWQGIPLRMYDAATGDEIADPWTGTNRGDWQSAVYSPDGTVLVAGAYSYLGVFDPATAKAIRLLTPTNRVRHLAFSRDGKRLATVDVADNDLASWRVRVWDTASWKETAAFPGTAVAFQTPGGDRVVVANLADHTLAVEDLPGSKRIARGLGHTAEVKGLKVTPDGRYAVSGSWDNTLRLWELPPPGGP